MHTTSHPLLRSFSPQEPRRLHFHLLRDLLPSDRRFLSEQAIPQILLIDHLTSARSFGQELHERRILQLEGVGSFDVAFVQARPVVVGAGLADVGQAPGDGDVVDGLLDRFVDEVHPHGRLVVLADSVHPGDGLELDGGVDEGFAEEDVRGVDEIEARRVGFGVEEETFDLGDRSVLERLTEQG